MSSTPEINYINIHIRDELKYLLCGAKVWKLIEDQKIDDDLHLQVYAMTSCFVRIRNLYLYFTRGAGVSISSAYSSGGVSLPHSALFAADKRVIESKVMHLNPPADRESSISINKKIIEYTEDILRIIADHLDNLETINRDAYEALLAVVKKCYGEAADIAPGFPNSEIFRTHIYEDRIEPRA
jgi:hypothetical protein